MGSSPRLGVLVALAASALRRSFSVDLGDPNRILGIAIPRSRAAPGEPFELEADVPDLAGRRC